MSLLKKEWEEYFKICIPKNAPPVQIIETRKAFYGGAWAFYSLLMNSLEPGSTETPQDMKLMASLDRELREFAESQGQIPTVNIP